MNGRKYNIIWGWSELLKDANTLEAFYINDHSFPAILSWRRCSI